MNEKKFSVLTYNINGYEIVHEIEEKAINPEIEYIYVTDDHSITSSTWTVVYVDDLTGSTFDKCYQIRFNPFKYVNTDIVMRIDGSMGIVNDVMPIFQLFEKEQYDAAVMIHPTRNTFYPEYQAWVNQRGFDVDDANKSLNFFHGNGYDVMNYRGLYQGNFVIQRRDNFCKDWNYTTYEIMKHFPSPNETINRLDQTFSSFVLNKFYTDKKIMPVGQYTCNGMFFNWYQHKTNNRMDCSGYYDVDPFLFDRQVYFAPVWC